MSICKILNASVNLDAVGFSCVWGLGLFLFFLLMGCAIPPSLPSLLESAPEVQIPESQFMGQYPSLVGRFKADYPNLKELSGSYHGDSFTYIMPDGKILTARKDHKKGVWNISIRQPYQGDVQTIMDRGVAW